MDTHRVLFSCGKMKINGKIMLVVAGGDFRGTILDSVELLDPSANELTWIWGKIYMNWFGNRDM